MQITYFCGKDTTIRDVFQNIGIVTIRLRNETQ